MRRIRRLPDHLINQIAAGEVVERPASVVKELIENAVDAGARSIDIWAERGGRTSIRVEDDGCGISPEDARLALERHATSKIAVTEDLAAIRTLGFRGEALPAIASVSRLTLRTAPDVGGGFRIDAEAGEIRSARPDAHPTGTTVEVRDLFFNTPARAKFMRAVPTELARISEVVQAAALAGPTIRFRLRHDQREILSAPPAVERRERIRQIFGAELAEGLLPLESGQSPQRVSGYVSRPAFSRATRSQWFLFVNDRQVADRLLSHAILQACRPRFPRDRFPALFLFLEVPPGEVDVNVHPAKREVRFRAPGAIHDLVQGALEEALGAGPVQEIVRAGDGAAREGAVSAAVQDFLRRGAGKAPERWATREPPPPGEAPSATPALPLAEPARRFLGQLHNTYILVEDREGLLLVDQHAAHERVLYDQYRKELRDGAVAAQPLLFPATVELSPSEAARLTELIERLRPMGFAVEPFGQRAFVVRELPARLSAADPARALRDLAEGAGPMSDFEHRVAALGACHASVRAGMRLEPARMERIVADLLDGGHGLTCPHGRPATLRYPVREIERAFLRPAGAGRG